MVGEGTPTRAGRLSKTSNKSPTVASSRLQQTHHFETQPYLDLQVTKIPLPLDRNFVMSFLADGSWAQNRVSLEIAKEISGIHAVISKRSKLQGPRATFRVLQETVQFQCTGLDCTALTGPTRRGGSLPIFSICPGPCTVFSQVLSMSLPPSPSCCQALRWSLLPPTRPPAVIHFTSLHPRFSHSLFPLPLHRHPLSLSHVHFTRSLTTTPGPIPVGNPLVIFLLGFDRPLL